MKNSTPNNDTELLEKLADGSESAFKVLYDKYALTVLRVAERVVGPDMADDLVQELFATVWVKRTQYVQVKNFKAYIIKMTKNIAIRHLKKAISDELATSEFGERLTLDNKELYTLFDEIIDQLSPRQQEIFHLAKVEGLSYEAIAELLDISHKTVGHHMSASLKFIKSQGKTQLSVSLIALLILSCPAV